VKYKLLVSSTDYQIARELLAAGFWFVSESRVREVRERREALQAEIERKRRARELRLASIADGRVAAFKVEDVMKLHADASESMINGFGQGRVRRRQEVEADGLDRLLSAVTAKAEEPVAA
jgi:hypothetical protein